MRFTIDFRKLPAAAFEWFKTLPEGVADERFFRASEYLNAYVDRLVHAHVAALRSEPVTRAGHWRWMLRKLELAGLAELDPWGSLVALSEPDEPAAALKEIALAEIPDLAPSFGLFDCAHEGYEEFLRGAREGGSILLSPSSLPVWQRYFDNADAVYAANNRVAAHLFGEVVESAGDAGRRSGLELLELGGGLGSAADLVLARAGGSIASYRFTEPFPYFLAGARRRLARAHPAAKVDYSALDVNQPFSGQGVADRSVDVVLAVNVLHVARNLEKSLAEVRRVLRPRGALVLVECVRPAPGVPIYVDYPFQLLDEFFRIEDAGPLRPHGGFLATRHWRNRLAESGFAIERELPDHDIGDQWYRGFHLVGFRASLTGT